MVVEVTAPATSRPSTFKRRSVAARPQWLAMWPRTEGRPRYWPRSQSIVKYVVPSPIPKFWAGALATDPRRVITIARKATDVSERRSRGDALMAVSLASRRHDHRFGRWSIVRLDEAHGLELLITRRPVYGDRRPGF